LSFDARDEDEERRELMDGWMDDGGWLWGWGISDWRDVSQLGCKETYEKKKSGWGERTL
jgi:hypothetical protein